MNGVDYGLTAAIVTNDLAKAMETADRVEAGYVWINSSGRYIGAPYGGWKQSGIGVENALRKSSAIRKSRTSICDGEVRARPAPAPSPANRRADCRQA